MLAGTICALLTTFGGAVELWQAFSQLKLATGHDVDALGFGALLVNSLAANKIDRLQAMSVALDSSPRLRLEARDMLKEFDLLI